MNAHKEESYSDKINEHEWTKIDEEYYDQMLNILPPIDMSARKFISCEPYRDNAEGYPLYFVGHINAEGYHGRLMTLKDYRHVRG